MNAGNLKTLVWILLAATGLLHLVVAAVGAPAAIKAPLAAFGVAYTALAFWVRADGRSAIIATMVVAAAGLALGGSNYLQNGGPITLPVMFLIDVIVIGAGAIWLTKSRH